MHVTPLWQDGSRFLGVVISFVDVSQRHRLHTELEQAQQEVETANQELQSTNEELETSNEELQSTVEELQTTNEELQSTNEELQSTNAELQAMNDELRQRTLEADRANGFLRSVMSNVDAGIVVINRDFEVLLWNDGAEDLWGLRAEEVQGRSLMELDIGLPVEALRQPLERAWSRGQKAQAEETVLDAVNRRGKAIRIHVTPSVRVGSDGGVEGLVLLMEEENV